MKNGGVLTIKARLNVGGDSEKSVVVQVEDTGTGISEEILGKIFDPFFTTKDVGQGTGLGLTISYGIMQKHDGEIIAVSEGENKGASFIIRLPLQ